MKNYFSSPRDGLIKISQVKLSELNAKLDTISKNILYITYKVDKISKYQQDLSAADFYDTHQEEKGNEIMEDV